MSKISKGPKKNIGQTWHPQLADKTAGVKTHFYWAMKNSNGNEDTLRFYLDNITAHYQNNHQNCHATSGCQQNGYVPSRYIITDENAAQFLSKAVKSTFIYKNPVKYAFCRDTHYIESFHNSILAYMDKRVHFQIQMYNLRIGLAILDWNENVNRPA